MKNNLNEPKSLPKTKTKTHIYPWAWTMFVSSVILFIGSVFFSTVTSTGPALFSTEESSKDNPEAHSFPGEPGIHPDSDLLNSPQKNFLIQRFE
ncbi:MAG: hypothetical protein RH949_21495 [Coleofasciculus sp. A1-SPW-01]|uniref:hypothetical protein n=1 Tax=Coleofasciculus sp. A1-SPW-01 TaxID=3070819 RepID=UPI0032F0FEDA